MPSESTRQMEQRLEAEGRLENFRARFQALKAEGMEGKPAWAQVKEEFSPEPDKEPALVPLSEFDGRSCPQPESVRWVAANLAVGDVQPGDAPSPESWGLLQWARVPANTGDFWRSVYVQTLPTRAQSGESSGDADDPAAALLADLLADVADGDEQIQSWLRECDQVKDRIISQLRDELRPVVLAELREEIAGPGNPKT